jgi:hypothetical protein
MDAQARPTAGLTWLIFTICCSIALLLLLSLLLLSLLLCCFVCFDAK